MGFQPGAENIHRFSSLPLFLQSQTEILTGGCGIWTYGDCAPVSYYRFVQMAASLLDGTLGYQRVYVVGFDCEGFANGTKNGAQTLRYLRRWRKAAGKRGYPPGAFRASS